MKLIITIFLSVFLFSACGKKDDKTDSGSKPDTTQAGSTTNQNTEGSSGTSESKPPGGIKNLTYETGTLPASVKYDGKLVAGAKWEDNNGLNVLIITETPEKTQSGEERMKELFAYQYVIDGESSRQLWKVNDFIKECPLDITLSYMPKSLTITDLDNNGIAENTFMYRMACKGDVSPDDMKLIMHEAGSKYAIRGSMLLELAGEKYGGEMKIDASFDKAPKEFLDHAKAEWTKFKNEKVGN